MYRPKNFKDDLLHRCQSDLISFAEAESAARFDWAYHSRPERRVALLTAVMELLAEESIEIGDAVLIKHGPGILGGFVDFRPWQGDESVVRSRLEELLRTEDDCSFAFWITRAEEHHLASDPLQDASAIQTQTSEEALTMTEKPDVDRMYDEAVAQKDEGDLEGAAAKLRALLQIEPDHVLSHSALAVYLQKLGQREQAVAHAQRVTELEPSDPFSFTQLSVICQRCGLIQEAEDAMARARQLQAGH